MKSLGQPLTWQPVDLSSGSVTFQPGQRYAVLASVTTGRTLQEVVNYATGKGFSITYSCEPPCSRNQYPIDQWLTTLPSARSSERWIYAEGTFNGGSPWTVSQTDSFPKTLIASYALSNVFLAAPGSASQLAPATTPGSATGFPWGPVLAVGAVAGVLGASWWWMRRRHPQLRLVRR